LRPDVFTAEQQYCRRPANDGPVGRRHTQHDFRLREAGGFVASAHAFFSLNKVCRFGREADSDPFIDPLRHAGHLRVSYRCDLLAHEAMPSYSLISEIPCRWFACSNDFVTSCQRKYRKKLAVTPHIPETRAGFS